ncbi:MAG: peptidase M3, partial [Gammaproteobacteria bacterium]
MDRRDFFAAAGAATVVAVTAPRVALAATSDNPFLQAWTLPDGAPPFDLIKEAHFMPAFDAGITERRAEIQAITAQRAAPTFANTLEPMESGGELLSRVQSVFSNRASAHTNPDIQRIQREVSPKLTALHNDIYLDAALFARIQKVYDDRVSLTPDQRRVVEKYHQDFVRAGAKLDAQQKQRVREIDQRLSALSVQFQQNQLADSNAFSLELKTDADRAGLPA